MTLRSRRIIAACLAVDGALAAALGVYLWLALGSSSPGSGAFGLSPDGTRWLMWLSFAAAMALTSAALLLLRSSGTQPDEPGANSLVPGWYDDQQDPGLLRFWDGTTWTERTARK